MKYLKHLALAALMAVGALSASAQEVEERRYVPLQQREQQQEEETQPAPERQLEKSFPVKPGGKPFRWTNPGGNPRVPGGVDSWKEFYAVYRGPKGQADRRLMGSTLPKWLQPAWNKIIEPGLTGIVTTCEQEGYPYLQKSDPSRFAELQDYLYKKQYTADDRLFNLTYGKANPKINRNVIVTKPLTAYVVSANVKFDTRVDGKEVSGKWSVATFMVCGNSGNEIPEIEVWRICQQVYPPEESEIPLPQPVYYEVKASAFATATATATATTAPVTVVINNGGGAQAFTPMYSPGATATFHSERGIGVILPCAPRTRIGINNKITSINNNHLTATQVAQQMTNVANANANNAQAGGKK